MFVTCLEVATEKANCMEGQVKTGPLAFNKTDPCKSPGFRVVNPECMEYTVVHLHYLVYILTNGYPHEYPSAPRSAPITVESRHACLLKTVSLTTIKLAIVR